MRNNAAKKTTEGNSSLTSLGRKPTYEYFNNLEVDQGAFLNKIGGKQFNRLSFIVCAKLCSTLALKCAREWSIVMQYFELDKAAHGENVVIPKTTASA